MADREIRIKVVVDEKGSISRLDRGLLGAQKSASGLVGALSGVSGVLAAIGASQVARVIFGIGSAAVKAASDVEEMRNLLGVTFGSATDDVEAWSEATAEAVGRSRFELQRFAGDFGTFLRALGTAPDQVVPMSQALAQLTVDLGSFRNLAEEDVLTKLLSGLAGETEAVRRLGVDLRASAVEAELLALGIDKTVSEATQAELVMARYSLLMKGTADAQGDAERTSDAYANQVRRLRGNVLDLQVTLGEQLLPAVTSVVQELNEFAKSEDAKQLLADFTEIARELAPILQAIVKIGVQAWLQQIVTVLKVGAPQIRLWSSLFGLINEALEKVGRSARGASEATSDWDLDGLMRDADRAEASSRELAATLRREAAEAAKKAAAEAKRLAEELDRLGDSARNALEDLGIGSREIRELAETELLLREAFEKGLISLGDYGEALRRVREEMAKLQKEATLVPVSLERINAELDKYTVHTGVGEVADDVSVMARETKKAEKATVDLSDAIGLVSSAAGDVFDALGEDEWAKVARGIENVIQQFIALLNLMDQAQAASGTAQSAASLAGAGGGAGGASWASLLSTAAGWVSFYIAAYQAFVALAEYLSGPDRDDYGGRFEYGSGGFQYGSVLRDEGEKVPSAGQQNEEFVGPFRDALNEAIRLMQNVLGVVIPDALNGFVVSVTHTFIEDGQEFFEVAINGISAQFDTLEEAQGFALQEFLKAALAAGAQVDEAVRQIIEGYSGDPAQFQEVLARVQGLSEQALMSLEGLSALEIEMRKLPASLQALEQELTGLGLSADQVTRLVGGAAVQSFNAWRQQITGQGLTIAQQREQQKAQAELFNAQLALYRAELEARRAKLIADAGLTEAEINILNSANRAYLEALKAKGHIYEAEVELIIRQIEAIDQILRSLPDFIDIGNLRLPGAPKLPKAPKVPRGGGGAAQDPFAGLQGLLDRLFPTEALFRQFREEFELLGKALDKGKISADTYERAIEKLNEQLRDQVGLTDLEDFLANLRTTQGPTSLTPARQILSLQRQLEAVADRARGGDIDAIREFQDIARRLQDLGASAFGTGAAGFERLLSFIETLGGDVLDAGNDLLEDQLDLMQEQRDLQLDMRDELAEIRQQAREQSDLAREGNQAAQSGRQAIHTELERGQDQAHGDRNALLAEMQRLRRELTEAQRNAASGARRNAA